MAESVWPQAFSVRTSARISSVRMRSTKTCVVSADGRVVYQHTGAALREHPRVISYLRRLAIQHVIVALEAKAGGPGVGVAPSGMAQGA